MALDIVDDSEMYSSSSSSVTSVPYTHQSGFLTHRPQSVKDIHNSQLCFRVCQLTNWHS